MTRKIGTAVIGLGSIGTIHAEWYSQIPESNLVAVCDTRKDLVSKVAARHKVRGYTDHRDLLENKEVEAVTVCPPNFLHAPIAIDAAKAGKHVAVEKPLSRTLGEADEMRRAVKKAGVHDLYMENLCFAPSFKLAKDIVDKGGLGDVYLCKARESQDFGYGSELEKDVVESHWFYDYERSGGGVLHTNGCHAIQYVRYVMDKASVTRVHCETIGSIGIPKPKEIEDFALLTMRFKSGQIGQIEANLYATGGGPDDKAEIFGNQGTILLDLYRRNPIVVHSRVGYGRVGHSAFISAQGDDIGWSFPIPEENYSLGYYQEQRHFLQSIIRDKRPRINFDDGRATLEVIMAGYRSSKTNQVVSLPLDQS